MPFAVDAARHVTSEPEHLGRFVPQELSMTLWAMARVVGRRTPHSRLTSLQPEVEEFALMVADEGVRRLAEFGPQGLSNVAWALATLELTGTPRAARFVLAAAHASAAEMNKFPPQAIANLCWALRHLKDASEELATFGAAA